MRVLILALDGLEYNLVLKWSLKNLMQKVCGSIEVGEEYKVDAPPPWGGGCERVPYTPIVWVSFLTGRRPGEHGVTAFTTYGRLLDRVRRLPPISWVRGKRKVLWRLGLRPRLVDRRDYRYPTIFDICRPSKAVYFMGYNQPFWLYQKLHDVAGGLGDKYHVDDLVRAVEEVYRVRLEELRKALDEEWVLLGAYFETLDWLGHLWIVKDRVRLYLWYRRFDELAKQLAKHTDILLVVSDHGMRPSGDGVTGNHSDRAFWSLNIETDWRPKDITDFYPKILEWCRR